MVFELNSNSGDSKWIKFPLGISLISIQSNTIQTEKNQARKSFTCATKSDHVYVTIL